jgi:FtsP/CotA-like multicopper oxidase with cupredoxin domain
LEPNTTTSKTKMGLNALVRKTPVSTSAFIPKSVQTENESLPEGCVRDLDPAFNEYRRVTFLSVPTPTPGGPNWTVKTEIVRPSAGSGLQDESTFSPADANETTIQGADGLGVPFEDYVGMDEHVDWKKRHVCIEIDHRSHAGSHKQLWALTNSTGTLHNFHIHQMKFRLATKQELEETYHILPPDPSQTCNSIPSDFPQPDYKCYDPTGPDVHDPGASPLWHDTIPMPPGATVFLVMSYDAPEQIGRFVFHCHILKHEDRGLMAPIEVWEPTRTSVVQKSTTQRKRK